MEFGDMMTDVFLGTVAQHLQFGAVGPLDDPGGTNPVQTHIRIVEKVLERPGVFREQLLGIVLLGDVAQHLRRRDDSTVGIADR